MTPSLSVVICTHNPREDYLSRALAGLQSQTLPMENWELILIDNASRTRLSESWDLTWHPDSHHIREEELGLTAARLRGIRESEADLLVLVDDDNILASDFLSAALGVAEAFPQIGAFGASTKGEFEVQPEPWITPYFPALAVSELDRDYWANLPDWSPALPFGAGLCVRRRVAEDYSQKVSSTPERKALGRKGLGLAACEDTDLALCAVDLGMGTGRFCSLKLTHLIPKERLSRDYIVKLNAGFAASAAILDSIRGKTDRSVDKSRLRLLRLGWRLLNASPLERRLMLSDRQARKNALSHLANPRQSQPPARGNGGAGTESSEQQPSLRSKLD